jgi:hypothetical protein
MTTPQELTIYHNVVCDLNDSAYWADLHEEGDFQFSLTTNGNIYMIQVGEIVLFDSQEGAYEESGLDLELKRHCHNRLKQLRDCFTTLTDNTVDWIKEK